MSRRRGNAHGFQFNKPLSMPDSRVVFRCYATHGKGYGGCPPFNSIIRILCLSASGEVLWADGFYHPLDRFTCDSMRGVKGWAMLGWVMSEQSLPLGELDRVDPALAQYDYLPLIDERDCSFRQFGQQD
jgi:hypothetical protein